MERDEFENHIRKNWPLLRSIARRFDPGPEIDDICQETILVAWRKRECLKAIEAFGAWLRAIGLNIGRAHARKRPYMSEFSERDAPSINPAKDVVDNVVLEEAFSQLTKRERETVELPAGRMPCLRDTWWTIHSDGRGFILAEVYVVKNGRTCMLGVRPEMHSAKSSAF